MRNLFAKIFFFSLIIFSSQIFSQQLNEYGLYVVKDIEQYINMVDEDSSKELVDLEEYIPGIVLDIKYATADNFTHNIVYSQPKAYARLEVAKALKRVQEELEKYGLGLKIFDAYRPYRFTVKFYELIRDSVFVASPWKGSRHNRGCAIDLTMIELSTKKEVEMPTPYDDFTDKAAAFYDNITPEARSDRAILQNVMVKNGFMIYNGEWWHFDFHDFQNYELMDISFEDLEVMSKTFINDY
ncbi:MAG TPA: M15 family metallopeptidase [Ignavibacteriaceae bacterium]|nr:M15 family metallopeptidase [Ignavibacteriaceae bacterium]